MINCVINDVDEACKLRNTFDVLLTADDERGEKHTSTSIIRRCSKRTINSVIEIIAGKII